MHKPLFDTSKSKPRWAYYIPPMSGRPNRDKVIDDDDICNLKIAIETSKTTEEFFDKV